MENMNFSPPNILIVDDINANLVVLSEMLRKTGYIARPVTSARQAISAIDALTPNLILLDISMPEIDGFTFCSMLKRNANTREIPIIFITAFDSTEDKRKGFQLGAVDYISKPFEKEEVTMRIDMHLKMYKIQQELELYNKKLYKIINDQIRKIYEGHKNVVEALAKLCSIQDESKATHMERIGKNSRILAIGLQLSPKFKEQITNSFIDVIEMAAPLHDIGTVAVDDAIMKKYTGLTMAEDEAKKSHTMIGAKTLEEILFLNNNNDFLKMAIDIARYHHENWDGSGYPCGVSGKDIPLSTRIVSIIDSYDSLVCSRHNQPVYSHEESIGIINDGSGTLFDPDMVMVLNKIHCQLKKQYIFQN